MGQKKLEEEVSPQAYKFINFADREMMKNLVNDAAVAKVDMARRQIAEALGVDVDEHVTVEVEMKFMLII